jgi:GT2 family glycosyltransferase
VKVVAVLVAYNRRDLLALALDALAAQTRKPDVVVVVDNASSDDSAELASKHQAVTEVVRLTENLGGAGGFTAGLARALQTHRADAVWLMDDDTAPEPSALAELESAWRNYPGRLSVASSRVVWTDGRDHPMNSQRTRLFASRVRRLRARQVGARPVRTGSFVSMLINARAARVHGLPRADFFIWNDDMEYSARLLRRGDGIAVPASVAVHHTKQFSSSLANPGPRFYYEVRNKVWTFFRSRAFGPLDRLAYLAYTLGGWARGIVRSGERRELVNAGLRGLRDGLRTRPRTNEEVFAGQPVILAEVRALDRPAR